MIVVILCTDHLHEKGLFPPVTYKPDKPKNDPEHHVDENEEDEENRLFGSTCI